MSTRRLPPLHDPARDGRTASPSALPAVRRRVVLGAGAAALAGAAPLARAAVGGLPSNVAHDASSKEFDALREQLWGSRPIVTGEASLVKLNVPLRAAFGASVPVKVVSALAQSPERYVKRMTVLVDKNPSQVAIELALTPEIGQADFETRLRVDEYSHLRVVSELSDGSLHMSSRYVKVSGGCTQPPNRDQLHNIGKTVMRTPEGVHFGAPTPVDLTVVHPNDTGFELNQITVMYIPPHFVRSIKVSYAGARLFEAETEYSVSENPSLRFNFVPRQAGELRADVEDSKELRYVGTLAIA